ncbi:MAG: UDP-N-acetylmuramoyl-L-alanine--D-glutamate ligase [Actinomycetaceae bacterium]|nr:UDP-N-acetylmuramoyl-L-alanine--D-glutamate ligase [Actinomycetaceae bacterium]
MSALKGADIGILGLGTSGIAAAEVLTTLGAKVSAYESNEDALEKAQASLGTGISFVHTTSPQDFAERAVAGGHSLYITSPGISVLSPVRLGLVKAGRRVISEVELAWRLYSEGVTPRIPWLTLTGTNGKTTTVRLLAHMLIARGTVSTAVGNVGTPIVQVVAEGACDVLAVELSSFQLHDTYSVSPWASACLNVAPDHIDWHGSFDAYVADKARVYERTQKACVYNEADSRTLKMVEEADVIEGCRAVSVTCGAPDVSQLGIIEDVLVDRAFLETRHKQALELATFADLEHLTGGVTPSTALLTDVLTAAALARAYGVEPEYVRQGLRDFELDAHRRQLVATVGGVSYIDDSKATNAHAAQASLQDISPGTAVWIAGGLAKGQDFTDLVKAIAPKLKAVVLIGEDQAPFLSALGNEAADTPVFCIEGKDDVMKRAVGRAAEVATPGDSVVLAPASASWDQFENYAQRGHDFADAVEFLGAKRE